MKRRDHALIGRCIGHARRALSDILREFLLALAPAADDARIGAVSTHGATHSTEPVGESVGVVPDRHIDFLHSPEHRDLVRRIEHIEAIALDRTARIEDGHHGSTVVAGDADQRSEREDARIGGHHEAAVGEHGVAAGGDPVGALTEIHITGGGANPSAGSALPSIVRSAVSVARNWAADGAAKAKTSPFQRSS